ncbi:MAG: flagellar basal body P-ring formation chaperone FlgA [Negativicutes bacterium]|nr:flagellar basal body P-ring formation chaperone FlgA [Negativicutes bacterium]MDR3592633.1 flagellar basal body P-ring formation chaperone FlgA [Negativicutes bacterium]
MRKIWGLTLLALWLLTVPVLAATDLTVVVNPENTLTGGQMILGDLATVNGDDPVKTKALHDLKLGNTPQAGSRQVLTADMLVARLKASGADFGSATWQIPPSITIIAAGQAVSGETLQATATAAIRQRLGGSEPAEVVATDYGTLHDVMVPPGAVTFRVELPYGVRFLTSTTTNIVISVDGRPYTTLSLRFIVKAYRNVVVATRNLPAGEVLSSDNLRLERWDVGRLTGYSTDSSKLLGLRTRRPIIAGQPIAEAAIEKPPLVKHGSAVTILAQVDGITASASGLALQEGSEGAVIRVQNLNSNKIVSARVIDGTTVQVILYSGR